MAATPQYHFEWDVNKARTNLQKHQISFPSATTVFRDVLALTIYDDEHSDAGDQRWVTIGQASNGQTLVVVHTFKALDAGAFELRLISARKADRLERRDYEQAPR